MERNVNYTRYRTGNAVNAVTYLVAVPARWHPVVQHEKPLHSTAIEARHPLWVAVSYTQLCSNYTQNTDHAASADGLRQQ